MQRIRFQTLGPVSMFLDQQEIDIGSPRQRFLLAVLLVEAGRPVSTEHIVERLWGTNPPMTARSALYTYVAQLRTTLTAYDLRLIKQRSGYMLDIDPLCVDLHRFHSLLSEARNHQSETRALGVLTSALALYHGSPFDGLYGLWVDAMRAAVLAEHRWAVVHRNEILLHLSRHAEIIGELSAAAAASPLDESIARQLMLALYRSGQRAAALQFYHQVRQVLADELGVDPGAALQCAYRELLRDERLVINSDSARTKPVRARTSTARLRQQQRQACSRKARPRI
jgi:DNA-binding SARP family transcriptional activator